MKDYLKAIILEQINRALSLKKIIPHPLDYAELGSLAERCNSIINSNIQQLEMELRELERRSDDIRDIFRRVRVCIREIMAVEYFGVSPLYYVTTETGYLNKLIYKIHKEINLPFNPPAVTGLSTEYYKFNSFTNVIFVPVGEFDFLLHLPDVFHEIGHEVLFNRFNDLRLKKLNEKYAEAIGKFTIYYQEFLLKKTRETGPRDFLRLIKLIHLQWKKGWIEEFFCDLFALYTLGPAYAWSHFHLTSKISKSVYEFSYIFPQTHPSDDARMKMLILGLNLLGFEDEATEILSKWNAVPFITATQPVPEYQYAYPKELLEEVAYLLLEGLKESGFLIISPEKLKKLDQNSIVKLLNDAWTLFWKKGDEFRVWEEENIKKLKSILS